MNSGKISNLSLTAESGAADAPKSATVTFEKETYVVPWRREILILIIRQSRQDCSPP